MIYRTDSSSSRAVSGEIYINSISDKLISGGFYFTGDDGSTVTDGSFVARVADQ